ncbi:acid phosphatase/Vanadium-dependent haloperoxidase [Artomyces pyxidatus]|uniref:Acid phosphatase/Vanadium-dependent haloperoxidase n=1 Tax=Artomyces pyxidatus TaxID=48021 RepID=A0ACB8T7B7_9AGAM|nr:acid phosphatase/Vanadium-dependent haloperoxidase [Artomyces pyxidatus]
MVRLGPGDDETSRRSRKKLWRLVFSYAPDWALTIIFTAISYALNEVTGFKRQFSVSDTSLLHPFAVHERVPDWALYIIAVVAPFSIQLFVNYISVRSWWDLHNSTLGLALGLSLAGMVTQFTKITVGRPRPDLISRCHPAPGTVDPPFGLSSVAICTSFDLLEDGFRSFPSGHSSLSFAGLGFLAFYLAGKMHLFDRRGQAKSWIAITPLCGAALVAISRTMDYRHHWQDVVVGSLLGLTLSYFSYLQYFPPLTSEDSHLSYSPRIHQVDPVALDHAPLSTHAEYSGGVDATMHAYSEDAEDSEDVELLDGTIRRDEPGPLRQLWKERGQRRVEGADSAV